MLCGELDERCIRRQGEFEQRWSELRGRALTIAETSGVMMAVVMHANVATVKNISKPNLGLTLFVSTAAE